MYVIEEKSITISLSRKSTAIYNCTANYNTVRLVTFLRRVQGKSELKGYYTDSCLMERIFKPKGFPSLNCVWMNQNANCVRTHG